MNRTATFRFHPGALDHIMRSRRLTTDSQLAALLGVRQEDVQVLRSGAPVSARVATRVAAIQGDELYLAGLFECITPENAAA